MGYIRSWFKSKPINYSGSIVIFQADLRKRYYDLTKEELSYEGIDYVVSLTLDPEMVTKMMEARAADVQQRMVDDANDETNKAVRDLKGLIEEQRNKISQISNLPNETDQIKASIRAAETLKTKSGYVVRHLCDRLDKIPEKRWKEMKDTVWDYRKYQVKSGVKVALGTAGVTVSIASLAASAPTAGGSLAVSIIGIQRSSVELYQQLKDLSDTAEQVLKHLIKDLEILNKANTGQHASRNLGIREVATSAVKAVTGYGGAVASVRGLRDNFQLLKNKQAGLMSSGRKFTILLLKLMDKVDNLAIVLRNKEYSADEARKKSKKIDDTCDKLDLILKQVISFNERWNQIGLAVARLQPEIGALNQANPRVAEITGRCLETLTNLTFSAVSGADAISGASGLFQTGKEVGSMVKDLAMEGIMSGIDIRDSVQTAKIPAAEYA